MQLLSHGRKYTVSKIVPPLVYYNFDIRERSLMFLAEMLPTK